MSSSFGAFGSSKIPAQKDEGTEPEPEPETGDVDPSRRHSQLVNGSVIESNPTAALAPSGGEEYDWDKELRLSITAAATALSQDQLDAHFVQVCDMANIVVDGPIRKKVVKEKVSVKFANLILQKLIPNLAADLETKMEAKCHDYELQIKQLNAKLAEHSSTAVMSEDSLSKTEIAYNARQKEKYETAMKALHQAFCRNRSGEKSRAVAQAELEMLEYREQMEIQITQVKDDTNGKRELRQVMLDGGLSDDLIDTGIDTINKAIQDKVKRIDQHHSAAKRLADAYRSALRGLGLSPEERDIALTAAIFSPSEQCFDDSKPDPKLGRTWMSDVRGILNQCPGRFWCIAPSILRMFNSQHYTGAGWRPKTLDQEYGHVTKDLVEIYADQSKDMYNFLVSKIEHAVQTSTMISRDTPMTIGNRTHDGLASWFSRAVEQDGVAVIEYWCHHNESKGREMREKLRLFFEKTAQLEISTSTKLSAAFVHIEKQFAVVRSYGPPDNFKVKHSKALTKMAAALHAVQIWASCVKNTRKRQTYTTRTIVSWRCKRSSKKLHGSYQLFHRQSGMLHRPVFRSRYTHQAKAISPTPYSVAMATDSGTTREAVAAASRTAGITKPNLGTTKSDQTTLNDQINFNALPSALPASGASRRSHRKPSKSYRQTRSRTLRYAMTASTSYV